jgi:iron complex outermembrane receptor protein
MGAMLTMSRYCAAHALLPRSADGALKVRLTIALILMLLLPMRVRAQRAEDNAVTAADDAFGTTVGNQTIGLYSPMNARGFSPMQAENLRIEGLYYDQQPTMADMYLFSGSDVRVGIAAQTYPFPSPTGIVDYKLRSPGDTALASGVLIRGPLSWASLELDSQYPLIRNVLSAGLNIAAFQNFDYSFARRSGGRAISLILRFRPTSGTEVLPFFGYVHNNEHQELPYVYAGGVDPLPLFNQQKLTTQNWSSWGWDQTTAGIIGRVALSSPWSLEVGLFRSIANDAQNFNDLLLGVTRTGIAGHVMDVVPPSLAGSYSGEIHVKRSVTDGAHRHDLLFTVRGRDVTRHYGGDSLTDLGSVSIYQPILVPQPRLAFSAQNIDRVRQLGEGVNYLERWTGVGSVSVGILKTDYSRDISTPGSVSVPQRTAAVLPTVSFTVEPTRFITAYGSYTRGLEDSVNAPTSAVNRGEPPPATPTWQVDGGVQILPHRNLKVILGAFEVHKSYFNLDMNEQYHELGDIRSRGIEASASLAGADGLTLIAGTVLLKPEIGLKVQPLGGSGAVPIGPVPATINLNTDYQPARWHGWGTSLQWTYLSSRVETADDRYELPPLSTINLGLRYSAKIFGRNWLTRLDVGNVTNASGLTISPLYLVLPQLGRNYMLTIAADL